MPVVSVTTMNQILAAWLGPDRAVGVPDSYDVELWGDDPRGDSPTAADFGGYAAVSWSSDDWETPDAGVVSSDGLVDFGAPTAGGSVTARYWSLRDPVTEEIAYSAPLANPLYVAAASDEHIQIRPVVPFGGRS